MSYLLNDSTAPCEGDVVRVTHRVNTVPGWDNVWVDDMDAAIGEIFTVYSIDRTGVYFVGDNAYGYPTTALERVPH